MLGRGEPTRRQFVQAAVAYLGPEAVVTGYDALRAHGVELPEVPEVHTLVSPERRVTPPSFVRAERTARLPTPVVLDGLPFAPVARSTIDAARHEQDARRLRALLTLPLYEGLCTLPELLVELEAGNQRGSAAVREQLRELGRTAATDVRFRARELLRRCPLPPPRWDTAVTTMNGHVLGTVDAWWAEVGLGWVVAEPLTGKANGAEHRARLALAAAGVTVVRTPSPMLRHHGALVVAELVRAFRTAATRPRPRVLSEARELAA